MPVSISATIITFNEERNITGSLASLDFVDEIIVVDSGSSDRTEEICRSNPKVRFSRNQWPGYGPQKNVAAALASHDWILNIDADERVTSKLKASLLAADRCRYPAFRMARENYFGSHRIKHCGWYPDYTTRFYDRTVCRFSERVVHETLELNGLPGTLDGNLKHFTYSSISDYIARMNRYSSLAAEEMREKGWKTGMGALLFKPFFTFFKMYVIRKGFLDGRTGLILSLLYATYTFCKYAKLTEPPPE